MIIDHENETIWMRQSWLDTYFRCPEEGRLAIVNPDIDGTSDEAFIGTAAHAGIEALIKGDTVASARLAVREEYRTNPEADHIKFTKRKSLAECVDLSERCFDAWVKDIMPIAPWEGGVAEMDFQQVLFEHRGWNVGVQGTADLVPSTGNTIWDWKTAGRDYKQKEKQMWAIQPTIYGMAAVMGAFERYDFTLPIDFKYGVMVKLAKQCRGQIVHVQRNAEHVAFAEYRMRGAVDLFLDFGIDKPWPLIDASNYLCSAKWCDFYDQCRGKFITQQSDLFGWTPK